MGSDVQIGMAAVHEDLTGILQDDALALAPEVEEGNVEYKLKLVDPTPERFEQLVSQLKWRMEEGHGEAMYEVGVADDGRVLGLSEAELDKSLATLKRMAKELDSEAAVSLFRKATKGQRAAQVLVRKNSSLDNYIDVRVAVAGNVDSGKSTLIGVLVRGSLDNGRGSARVNVFRHRHEVETGRTSAISHQIMGFDAKGDCVNYVAGVRNPTWSDIIPSSTKLISFMDLAGHEKYLKTTVFGLCQRPDYCLILVGANMGVTRMTKEHIGICLALRIPLIVGITKIDMCPDHVLTTTINHLTKLLKSAGARKLPMMVHTDDDLAVCVNNIQSDRITPIFKISNVSGEGIDLLRRFLNLLPVSSMYRETKKPAHFMIDDTFHVQGVGTVVAGNVLAGHIKVNDTLLLGPDGTGAFKPCIVKSIHTKHQPVSTVQAGHAASFAIRAQQKVRRNNLRKGMVMVDTALQPSAAWEFSAEVLILHHPTTIHPNYQPVIHCMTVRQSARIMEMDSPLLRTGDKSTVRFRFMYRPEFLVEGERLIFREGRTKGIGRIVEVHPASQSQAGPAQA